MEDHTGDDFQPPHMPRLTPEPGGCPEDHLHDEGIHSSHSPNTSSSHFPLDLEDWSEEEEWDDDLDKDRIDGQDDEDDEEEIQSITATDEPMPQATLPKLSLAQQLIKSIQDAKLEDDIETPRLLHSLWNLS